MRFSATVSSHQSEPVIQLADNYNYCKAEIYAFGSILNHFSIQIEGNAVNCIDGFESPQQAARDIRGAFKSAKISPFVCRLHKGTYIFNQENYTIQKNYLNEHALHGLLYDARFTIDQIQATDTEAEVTLSYHYKGTDAGYPFPFQMQIIWTLFDKHQLRATTRVIHQNQVAIPYADGWHPYFSLGGKVDEYQLQFDADTQLEFDETLIPTGKKLADTRFLTPRSLEGIFLDNSFVLKENGSCTLCYNALKLRVTPDATYPILQVYTPPHRNSIAIENLSGAPDNFNNQIGLLNLAPNKWYEFTTAFQLNSL